jgi:type IV pilus assembly protein PilN
VIRINLLPQEERSSSRGLNMSFTMPAFGNFIPIGVAAVALVACLGTYFVQTSTVEKLEGQLEVAREESQRLAPQIARIQRLQREREQLDSRLDAITSLDEERYFRVKLMSELARRTPENLWLTSLQENSPGQFTVSGITFSNFIVADFISNLSQAELYRGLDLVRIQRGKIADVTVLDFEISATVTGMIPASTPGEL